MVEEELENKKRKKMGVGGKIAGSIWLNLSALNAISKD